MVLSIIKIIPINKELVLKAMVIILACLLMLLVPTFICNAGKKRRHTHPQEITSWSPAQLAITSSLLESTMLALFKQKAVLNDPKVATSYGITIVSTGLTTYCLARLCASWHTAKPREIRLAAFMLITTVASSIYFSILD
jgi:hypothetical protein